MGPETPKAGVGYTIEQGPEWLVDFYLHPPSWLNPSLKVLALVVVCIVAYRLYQRGGEITMEQQRAMLQIAATVIGVMSGVLFMTNYMAQPYGVDVGVGFLVGYGVVTLLANVRLPLPLPDARTRLSAGWVLLAVCSFVFPTFAAMNGRGTLLGTVQWYVMALGLVMAAYNQMIVEDVLPVEATD